MLSKEEEQQYFEAMDNYHKDLDEKWTKAKESLEGLIHPKYFDFAQSNETYYSEGLVEVIEFKKQNGEPYFKIKDAKNGECYTKCSTEIECYNFDSEYEGEKVDYLVWQTTGFCEDDYHGFLLLPLLDGKRFWRVGYSC